MNLLEVKDLSVSYKRVPAVREINFHVAKGEIVTILGLNGAGKTSTLEAIVGKTRKSGGSVTFRGEDITRLPMTKIARNGITLVPEGRHVFARMSVKENLELAATASKKAQASEIWEKVLDVYPKLRQILNRPAGMLSGGEQQQLVIARAMLTRPQLMLLDEPSLGLAPSIIDTMFETIVALRDEGTTILIVEQNAHKTLRIADRAYVMSRGKIVLNGKASELSNSADFHESYFG